jgi:hypothetical protein
MESIFKTMCDCKIVQAIDFKDEAVKTVEWADGAWTVK